MKKKEQLLLILSIISVSISITQKIKKHLGEKKNVEPINISLKDFIKWSKITILLLKIGRV